MPKIKIAPIRQRLRWNSLWFIVSLIAVSMAMIAASSVALIMNFRFDASINSAALANNTRIVAAAADRIDNYILEIVRSSRVVAEMTEAFPERTNLIDDAYYLLPENIDTIAVFSDTGELEMKTDSRVLYPPKELISQSWFSAVAPGSRLFILSNPHIQHLYPGEYRWVVSMSSGLAWNSGGQPRRGVMLVDINLDFIREICSSMMSESAYLYVVSEDGQIVYHPDQQGIYSGVVQEDTLPVGLSEGSTIHGHGKDRALINAENLNYARWRVVGVSSLKGVLSFDEDMPAFIITIVATILLFVAILAFWVSFSITRPLRRLMALMERVESGEFELYDETRGIYEVTALSDSFNQMVTRVKLLMERVLTEQQALRKSEVRALHAQINPHFLYNTLDSVVWLAERGDRDNAVKMIEALSGFFRLTLHGGKDIIPARDELKCVESYLTIQKMRFGDKFDFEISADPSVDGLLSMKMLLQPLVENAVVHGLGSEKEGGVISVRAYAEEDCLVYEVRDNGFGMEPETLDRLRWEGSPDSPPPDSGIGIQNIRQRIRLFYGGSYGLTFESEPDEGTLVTVRIPILSDADSDG